MSHLRRPLISRLASLTLLVLSVAACTHPAPERGPRAVTTIPAAQLVFADSLESRPTTEVLPRYPVNLQAQEVPAAFFAYVIVDTVGRVDVSSARFGRAAQRPFYDAVCSVLPRIRFAQVRRNGQARPALVVLQYSFMIGDDTTAHRKLLDKAGLIRQMIRSQGMDSTLAILAGQPRC